MIIPALSNNASRLIDRYMQNNGLSNEFSRHDRDVEEQHRHDIDRHEHSL